MSEGKPPSDITGVESTDHVALPEASTENVNVWKPEPPRGAATGLGLTVPRIRKVSALGVAACHSAAATDTPVLSTIAMPPLPSPEPLAAICTLNVAGR